MIFETHAHYDDKMFDEDRESLLESMQEAGIGIHFSGSVSRRPMRKWWL